jgi:hypothetical protein
VHERTERKNRRPFTAKPKAEPAAKPALLVAEEESATPHVLPIPMQKLLAASTPEIISAWGLFGLHETKD